MGFRLSVVLKGSGGKGPGWICAQAGFKRYPMTVSEDVDPYSIWPKIRYIESADVWQRFLSEKMFVVIVKKFKSFVFYSCSLYDNVASFSINKICLTLLSSLQLKNLKEKRKYMLIWSFSIPHLWKMSQTLNSKYMPSHGAYFAVASIIHPKLGPISLESSRKIFWLPKETVNRLLQCFQAPKLWR